MRRLSNYRIINYLQNEVYRLKGELSRTQQENKLLKKEILLYQQSQNQEWLF